MNSQTNEQPPAPVPRDCGAPQAGAPHDRWSWVERCVWTDRMLTRLTSGEPADRVWFRLWDKTYAPANLARALEKVRRNGGSAGADEQTVAYFSRHAEAELARLQQHMRAGTYRPQPVGAQARKSRATPAGYISGARPGSASRFAARVGNYLRAGVFPTPMPILRLGIVALIGFAMTGVSRYG